MTDKAWKVLRIINKLASIAFVLVFGFGSMYVVIDLVGTLNHMWVGNAFSVAVAAGMDNMAAIVGANFSAYVAPGMKAAGLQFYAGWVGLFAWFGLSERTASITLVFIGLITDLGLIGVVIFYYVRWSRRRAKKLVPSQ